MMRYFLMSKSTLLTNDFIYCFQKRLLLRANVFIACLLDLLISLFDGRFSLMAFSSSLLYLGVTALRSVYTMILVLLLHELC